MGCLGSKERRTNLPAHKRTTGISTLPHATKTASHLSREEKRALLLLTNISGAEDCVHVRSPGQIDGWDMKLDKCKNSTGDAILETNRDVSSWLAIYFRHFAYFCASLVLSVSL